MVCADDLNRINSVWPTTAPSASQESEHRMDHSYCLRAATSKMATMNFRFIRTSHLQRGWLPYAESVKALPPGAQESRKPSRGEVASRA